MENKSDNGKKLFDMYDGLEVPVRKELHVEPFYSSPLDEAEEIYQGISSEIGRVGSLYKYSPSQYSTHSFANAPMAMLCSLLEKDEEAEEIYEEMRSQGMLSTDGPNYTTYYIGIMCKLLGKDEEARKIYDTVGVKPQADMDGLASYAILSKIMGDDAKAEGYYKYIETKMTKDGALYSHSYTPSYSHSKGDSERYTYENALMAILCQLLGKEKEGDEIYEDIQSRIRKDGELYRRSINLDEKCTHPNALMGVYLCLKAGKLRHLNK